MLFYSLKQSTWTELLNNTNINDEESVTLLTSLYKICEFLQPIEEANENPLKIEKKFEAMINAKTLLKLMRVNEEMRQKCQKFIKKHVDATKAPKIEHNYYRVNNGPVELTEFNEQNPSFSKVLEFVESINLEQIQF